MGLTKAAGERGRMYWLIDGEVIDIDVRIAPAEERARAIAAAPELGGWASFETRDMPGNVVLWVKPGKRIAELLEAGLTAERSRESSEP